MNSLSCRPPSAAWCSAAPWLAATLAGVRCRDAAGRAGAEPVAPDARPVARPQIAAEAGRGTPPGTPRREAAAPTAKEAADASRRRRRRAKPTSEAARASARITIDVDVGDRQYDSFDQFLDRDPALASMVLGIVFIVFLTPILIIALIIWYKMRKNRMQNETMLKLAEKGVVAAGRGDAGDRHRPRRRRDAGRRASAPLAEQAQALRKRAAWSDLRKGVLMGARRPRAHVLRHARRRLAELVRPRAAVRRHRLHRALVLRGPAGRRAPRRPAPAPVAVRGPGDTP